MSYRTRKFYGSGRGHHSPVSHAPRSHSPRVSGCKLARLPRPVRTNDRPLLVSRDLDSLPPLEECDLITQIYAAQRDLPLREFSSYFNGRTQHNVPPCLTSHAGLNRFHPVMPLINTFRPSVTWDPNQKELHKPEHAYNCRCFDCSNARCQAEANNMTNYNRNFRFKNNIIRYCDQQTMTSKANDVSCGICLGVGIMQESKGIDVSTSGLRPKSPCPPNEAACSRTVQMTRPGPRGGRCRRERRKPTVHEEYFENCWPERRCNEQDEAVRDTDPPGPSPEPVEPPPGATAARSPPSTLEERGRLPYTDINACPMRKMLYNEGISDEIANNLPTCVKGASPPIPQETLSNSSLNWRCCETDTWIPYSHRGASKYHTDCKKPADQRYRCDHDGEIYQVAEWPRKYLKKMFCSKPQEPLVVVSGCGMNLPRKVLASEKNIESFICKENTSYDYDSDGKETNTSRFGNYNN